MPAPQRRLRPRCGPGSGWRRRLRLEEWTLQPGTRGRVAPGRFARIVATSRVRSARSASWLHGVTPATGWLGEGRNAVGLDGRGSARCPRRDLKAREVSRYPASDMDLAFVVDDSVSALAVLESIRDGIGEELESIVLFDTYRSDALGPARRSLAYRLRRRSAHQDPRRRRPGSSARPSPWTRREVARRRSFVPEASLRRFVSGACSRMVAAIDMNIHQPV